MNLNLDDREVRSSDKPTINNTITEPVTIK